MKTDKRYTIAREYCGYVTARHVARFCGAWLGQSETEHGAARIVKQHKLLNGR